MDTTIEWLRKEYEVIFSDGSGAMKVRRGKIHEYLGMLMDFTTKGEVHITMLKHLDDVVETFEKAQEIYNQGFKEVKRKRSASQKTAAPKDLFVINDKCEKLRKQQQKHFQSSQSTYGSTRAGYRHSSLFSHQAGERTRFRRLEEARSPGYPSEGR